MKTAVPTYFHFLVTCLDDDMPSRPRGAEIADGYLKIWKRYKAKDLSKALDKAIKFTERLRTRTGIDWILDYEADKVTGRHSERIDLGDIKDKRLQAIL